MSDWHEQLLPPNQTPWEAAIARASGAQLNRLSVAIHQLRDLHKPTHCEPDFLPWLAWQLHVDDWDVDWSIEQQRQMIAASREIHYHKGTIGALRSAMSALGLSISLTEWWQTVTAEPDMDPFTFKITVTITETGATLVELNRLYRVIQSAKNARSQLAGMTLEVEAHSQSYHATFLSGGTVGTIEYDGQITPPIFVRGTSDGAARITSDDHLREVR